jgi:hypothetical protein
MERLREDLINKSKLVKSSSQTITPSSARKVQKKRVQKIYKFSLKGGSEDSLYQTAKQIEKFVCYLLEILQKRINNDNILNIFFILARLYLRFILLIWKIDLKCCMDSATGQEIFMTMVYGGTTPFIVSWIGVGATLAAHFLGVVFMSRSLTQQLIDIQQYRKYRNQFIKLLKDEEVQNILINIAEKVKTNKQKIKTLNWEKDPTLKEAAERLGIFKEKPNFGGKQEEDHPPTFSQPISGATEALLERRGGAIEMSLDELDLIPIFCFIILQKNKLKFEKILEKERILKEKPILLKFFTSIAKKVERILKSVRRNKSLLVYLAFAIASWNVRTTNISPSRRLKIQPDCFELRQVNLNQYTDNQYTELNASTIKIGDTLIHLGPVCPGPVCSGPVCSPEISQETKVKPGNRLRSRPKVKMLKPGIRKRGKLMKFSDLPPLSSGYTSLEFEESFPPSKVQPGNTPIPIKEKN